MSLVETVDFTGLARTDAIRASFHIKSGKAASGVSRPTQVSRSALSSITFFQLTDVEAVRLIGISFAPELDRLKQTEPSAEVDSEQSNGNLGPSSLSPSQFLFHEEFPEVNRTVVGILALKWLIANDYDTFTAYQDSEVRLEKQSFETLRDIFHDGLQSSEDIYALIVATLINDLGKDDSLWEEVQELLPKKRHQPNHDEVLYLAAQLGLVPLMSDFQNPSPCRTSLNKGLRLGSNLNVAQFAQAENVPASLLAIHGLGSDRHALNLKFFEILLDVAGAQGHLEARCSKTMTEPLYQSYSAIREALFGLSEGDLCARDAYDTMLSRKADTLLQSGFRRLRTDHQRERALLRLLCMARASSYDEAEVIDTALGTIGNQDQNFLVDGLSVDGINDGDAIVPYYAPSLFAVLFRHLQEPSKDKTVEVLRAVLRFLSRVYAGTKPMSGRPGRVIECDLRFAQTILKSTAFIKNPSVLDDVQIPKDAYGDATDTEHQ
ncbi:hypothetical protein MMC10_003108 [Thelotrema lepadinum]|nr:hypothetical protein [Thelotrema lepadinum]